MPVELQPPGTESTTSASAPDKDRHDFLVALLKESRYGMIDFMFKQAAVLTLFIGWVLSSDDAQRFIAAHSTVRFVGVVAVAVYAVLLVFWSWTYGQRSETAHTYLLQLRYMPAKFYAPLVVTRRLAVSLVSAHIVLCAVLTIFLFQLGD